MTYRGRFAALTVAFLLATAATAALGGGAAAKRAHSKPTLTAKVTKAANQAIPDGVSGGAPGILRSSVNVGKKFQGRAIGDVNLTFKTTGAGDAASDLRLRLTAPSGNTVTLIPGAFGGSIGPLTFDDESPVRTCPDATPPCIDPDRSLGVPFAGTATPQTLFDLDGGPVAGTWTLRVIDVATGETSVLDSWSLKIAAETPATKAGKTINVTRAANAQVPDALPLGPDGILRQTIEFGKKAKGQTVGDVNVTVRTAGSSADAAEDIRMRLMAPGGNVAEMVPNFSPTGLPGQSVGPLKFDDETPIQPCFDDTPPCGDPDTLPQPFAGTAQPTVPLSGLDGGPVRGPWTLTLEDSLAGDTSTLDSWRLSVTPRKASAGAKTAKAAKTKKKGGGAKRIRAASTSPQPIPETTPGVTAGLLRSKLELGKRYKGLRVADVNVTVQTVGTPPLSGNNLDFRLTAPNGATSYLESELDAQSIGPLTFDDESSAEICNSASPPCDNPDATVVTPFSGTTAPTIPLRIIDGGPVRGTWTLSVLDFFSPGANTLSSWRLAVMPRGRK